MPTDFPDAVRALGIDLDPDVIERFRRYRDLMAEAARQFSLTAVREPAQIERRHFLESLAFGRLLAGRGLLPDGARVIDIGSGAGLPGLPLKLAWPSLRLALLESNSRRCRFLGAAIRELGLGDVAVLEGRSEHFGRDPAHRAAYDLVVARAVAPLPILIEYALPFLRLGGRLAVAKGSGAQRELDSAGAALQALGGRLEAALAFQPPGGLKQTVIVIVKETPTPERYPRRAGLPAKRPII